MPAGLFPPSQPSVMTSTIAQPVMSSQIQSGHTQPVYMQHGTVPSLYANAFGGNRFLCFNEVTQVERDNE